MNPKAPAAWPLVGHLPAFLHDKLGFLTRCAEEYGDTVPLRIGEPTFLLNDAADIQHVLIDHSANYSKTWRLTSPRGKRFSGNGLHTSFGADHLRQRRMLQPVFSRSAIEELFFEVMLDRTSRRIDAWTQQAGVELDVAAETESLALSIILGSIFGLQFPDEKLAAAVTLRRGYIEYFYESLLPYPEHWPFPMVRRYRRAQASIDAIIRQQLEHPSSARSFLTSFAAATYADGSRMDFHQQRDEILTLMSTGYETIGDALAWTLYLLVLHPDVESQVIAELETIPGNREPSAGDITKLTFTRQVLDESMRLYPPTWLYIRMALSDDTLPNGIHIRKNSKLYLCQYVTHRSAKYFPEPLRFDPGRFAPGEAAKRPRFSYFPFGGGTRQCIGEHFALLEGVTVLALLLRRFRFQLIQHQAIVPRPTITLRPRNGIRVKILPR
ncbi:MAG TPA: cytochrome P450 [Bryobacteraceae bacterium]|nr:cytochrome P450 [Bryobacteraceae bacterium]